MNTTEETELRSSLRRLRAEKGDACVKKAATIVAEEAGLIDSRTLSERERLEHGMRAAARMGLYYGPNTGGRDKARIPITDAAWKELRETRSLTSASFSTGGQLPTDVQDLFLDYAVLQAPTLQRVQVRRLNNSIARIDRLDVAAEKRRKLTEGVAPSATNPTSTASRSMTTVESGFIEDITLTFIEDNLEKAGAEAHVGEVLAKQFGSDEEQIAWRGDDASGDPFVSINNGWLKLFAADGTVHAYDATSGGAGDDDTAKLVLQHMFEILPAKFRDLPDLTYFVPYELALTYAEEVGERQTFLGDQVLEFGSRGLRYYGLPVVPTTALTAAGRKAVLTSAKNLVWGVQRDIRIDSQFNARTRMIELTFTCRTDYEYANGDLVVLASNILPALL